MRKRKKKCLTGLSQLNSNKRPTPFTMPNKAIEQFLRTREHRKVQMKTVADQLPI